MTIETCKGDNLLQGAMEKAAHTLWFEEARLVSQPLAGAGAREGLV